MHALRDIWDVCFPGDTAFGDFFFSELYKPEQALVFQCEDSITSMLHMLPFKRGDGEDTAYIYGVGTLPEYRRQGQSAALIKEAMRLNPTCFLIPQEEWLYGFYEQFGFKTVFYEYDFNAEIPASARLANVEDIPAMNAIYQSAVDVRVERSGQHWGHILNGGGVFIWDGGYAIAENAIVTEAFGTHTSSKVTGKPLGMANKWQTDNSYLNFMYN
jgi:GNAT superfamily N-acetyltransferase